MIKILNKIGASKYTKLIPIEWKLKLKFLLSKKNRYPQISKNELKIIVTIAANYGNLGDISITYAQKKFLMEHFPNYKMITLYANDFGMLSGLKKSINPKDIITTIGGGNMGDVYEGLEVRRRQIIKLFPNNKIISFPQTMDFKGEKSLNKSRKVYAKHKDLHLFAREPESYEMMKECFSDNHVYLVPDIVLSLNLIEPKLIRDGIILCLRNDQEQKISNMQKESLLLAIKDRYPNIHYYDTHIGKFPKGSEEQALENIWTAFKKSKVVVTDRLHGMIFCAITKTPCVVLPNTNHKIASTYKKWLANLNYIAFVKIFDEQKILGKINSLFNNKTNVEEINLDLIEKFGPLLEALKNWPL
ncbi:polysaccharide pyruvyl transferase family protein [Neobacillus sp. NPDC093127]|uniref:polysaccharide pyruvyl transferase family protein n=1 Tax=Neobacillus sp. NPDC093127 TaxID=3364296 RepID=UPI00382E72E1